MPNNMVLLETIALTQSAASVTFDNLPTSGYTDLKIVASARGTSSSTLDVMQMYFNGNQSITYSWRFLRGDGSSATSSNSTSVNGVFVGLTDAANNTASTFSNTEIYIPNYRSTSNKSISVDSVHEQNGTTAYAELIAGLAPLTSAITSATIFAAGASFVANSTFSLYGIAAYGTTPVTAPKATGGNIVANDGTYWYHAFTSSGNFVPQVGLTADVLVIAGGGGSGGIIGGGGGAGGLRGLTGLSLTNGTNYSCVIGAGGGAGDGGGSYGVDGSNSSISGTGFSTVTATGGGSAGGGSTASNNGKPGGSGAGGSYTGGGGSGLGGAGNLGGYSPVEGFAGGNASGINIGGGGGGATGAGSGATPGNGSNVYSSWGVATLTGQNISGTYWYAGGGGGGSRNGFAAGTTGGSGGGGGGSQGQGNGNPGQVNTGGGAGGAGYTSSTATGSAGGSGIVIIRYPIA